MLVGLMASKADLVAQIVIDEFNKLPPKRKPTIRDNGLHEWVPLSGIVAEHNGNLTCIALATGMKCLPATKLSGANGICLHDWHAEILAIRTFNRYLLDICNSAEVSSSASLLQKCQDKSPYCFTINPEVKLHMYCSEAPCGDASMELTMGAQKDASAWNLPSSDFSEQHGLPGRAFFSQLGIVRRKPARGDAIPTLSKSCSDKIALNQCTSLLSSVTSLLISPENAYVDTIIVPLAQYSQTGFQRAFSPTGRLQALVGKDWDGGYSFNTFAIESTTVEFPFSKRSVGARSAKISASNSAVAWSRSGIEESLIGGIIQGRKLSDIKCASKMSRRRMTEAALEAMSKYSATYDMQNSTYQNLKKGVALQERRHVKNDARELALKGWARSDEDSSFIIT